MGGVGRSRVPWGGITGVAVSCRGMGGVGKFGAASEGLVSCRWVMGISGAAAGIGSGPATGETAACCWLGKVVRSATVAEGAISCRCMGGVGKSDAAAGVVSGVAVGEATSGRCPIGMDGSDASAEGGDSWRWAVGMSGTVAAVG